MPTRPTSPSARGSSESRPELGRQVEGDVQRVLPVRHQVLEALVRLRRRAEADVLPHRPQARAVHVGVDAPRERVVAGLAQVAGGIEAGEVAGPVDGLDRDAVEIGDVPERPLALVPCAPRPCAVPPRRARLRARRTSARKYDTISGSGVPIGNTARTPSGAERARRRAPGIVPPTTTAMSPAPAAWSRVEQLPRQGQVRARKGPTARSRRRPPGSPRPRAPPACA